VTATQVDASDPRSLKLLEELLREHQELMFDFAPKVEALRQAVSIAKEANDQAQPVVHKGWKGALLLKRSQLRWWIKSRWARITGAGP
jgi:hypothetical protein